MVVERIALVDAVGNAAAAQVVLDDERLVVRAVEDRHVAPPAAGGTHAVAQVGHHLLGLVAVGVGLEQADLLARGTLREAALLHAFRVALDHRIGRLHDGARRAVVLFELEGHGVGIVLAEREDVLDLGAAERIDRLRVVAHDAHFRAGLRQPPDDDVLGVVRILVLVHENIMEQLLVAGQHIGTVAQQDVGLEQQVVEVHRTVAFAALTVELVERAELGHLGPAVLGGEGGVGLVGAGRHEAVFRIGYARSDGVGLVPVVGQVQLAHQGLYQVAAVRGFVDREGVGVADALGVLAQDAREDRVEGSHADVAAAALGDHLRDALAHLLGGFVGEGEGQDVPGLHALLDHVGDAGGEHAGLARSGACDDERRHVVVLHGGTLGGIQPLQYLRFHRSLRNFHRKVRDISAYGHVPPALFFGFSPPGGLCAASTVLADARPRTPHERPHRAARKTPHGAAARDDAIIFLAKRRNFA